MRWKNTTAGYGYVAVTLHWLSVILVVVTYALMDLKFLAARGSVLRSNMAGWHYAAGLTLFFLTWLRLLMRIFGNSPTIDPPPKPLQRLLARAVRIALYGILLGLPMLGWLTLNANGHQINYFGLSLPTLAGKDPAWARDLKELHEGLATIGYFLILLHTLAALFHYYIEQNNTVQMMWFRRKKS